MKNRYIVVSLEGEDLFEEVAHQAPSLKKYPEGSRLITLPYDELGMLLMQRQASYPSYGEFADAFIADREGDSRALDAWISKCREVKAQFPKPPPVTPVPSGGSGPSENAPSNLKAKSGKVQKATAARPRAQKARQRNKK